MIDTVFVCRSTGKVQARDFEASQDALERMLDEDIADLEKAGHAATPGDARCMLLGHMVRLAVWQLRSTWQSSDQVSDKLKRVQGTLNQIYALDLLSKLVNKAIETSSGVPLSSPLV